MDLSKAEMFSRELELSDDGDLLVKVDQVLECNMTVLELKSRIFESLFKAI